MTAWRLAARQFRRHLAAGEIRLLLAALVLSVFSVGSIHLLVDRAERALAAQANRLLGGDSVLRADQPIDHAVRDRARALGLRQTETWALPSMVRAEGALRLGELRALAPGFPLRGAFEIDEGTGPRTASGVPKPGTVWIAQAGARTLGVSVGDRIDLGERAFRVAALVIREPDAAMDYFNVAPRVFMALEDVEATGLVQPGSRVTYRLIVAGSGSAIRDFETQTRASLARGQRLESAADARPELRQALDRAGQFLGIVAVLAVVLAAAAMAMAARQHSQRQVDAFAVMRCFGAAGHELLRITLGELALVGMLGTSIGVLAAWGLAILLGRFLSPLIGLELPPPAPWAILPAVFLGIGVLFAFAGPPLLALRRVPAMRVLRRDVPWQEASALVWGGMAAIALGAMLWWQAGSAAMAIRLLGGIVTTLLVLAGMAWGLVRMAGVLRHRLRGPWRLGVANLSRRPSIAVAQTTALGLGLMALLLLLFVRGDLLERWRTALPADAPNRFLLNAQPDQLDNLGTFLKEQGLRDAVLWPMARARYVARNGEAVTPETYADAGRRARRLAEREFNLSTVDALGDDNHVVAGTFWTVDGGGKGVEFSVEQGLAETLGWSLGDTVRFDVAGTPLEGRVTSLREVQWESFKPNFFVLVSPAGLSGLPVSYISAIHLPPGQAGFTRALLDRFPNLSVVDIDAILGEVTRIADQVSRVIEAVFLLAIAAGILVLLAAVLASQDERLREGAVMRVLGASRSVLRWTQAGEFLAIGLVAGGVAAVAATMLSGVVAGQLGLSWRIDPLMVLFSSVAGALITLVSGMLAVRKVLNVPPASVLRGS